MSRRLSRGEHLGYGVGSAGTGIFSAVPGLLLLYFLTDTLAVPAALAGIAVFAPKIWDVVTDPVIGTLSDRTRSRWGRRRPYLLAGGLSLPVFFALMFAVPDMGGPMADLAYVIVMYVLAATAFTLFQVPYIAMPAEMTADYHERTTVMSYRMAAMAIGILLAGGAAPAIVELAGGGRGGYAVMAASLGVLCLAAMLTSFFATRGVPAHGHVASELPVARQIRLALGNRPFGILVAALFIQLTAMACILAAVPFYAKYVLMRSDLTVTVMFVTMVLPTVVTMPLWVWLSRRLGKLTCYVGAVVLFAAAAAALYWGGPERIGMVYALVAAMGLAYAATQLFPYAMLPDAIDVDHRRTGLRREGGFTGVWTAAEKTGMACGGLLAGLVLGQFGFVESAAGETAAQPDSAQIGIRLAFSAVPAALLLASVPVLLRYRRAAERAAEGDAATAAAQHEGGDLAT